jgi:hypothetical protein
VVEDGWQRRGVGELLLSLLAEDARRRSIETLSGVVLPGNGPMRSFIATSGGLRYSVENGEYLARVPLLSSGPAGRISGDGSGGMRYRRGERDGAAEREAT